jgi:hypothetical protein
VFVAEAGVTYVITETSETGKYGCDCLSRRPTFLWSVRDGSGSQQIGQTGGIAGRFRAVGKRPRRPEPDRIRSAQDITHETRVGHADRCLASIAVRRGFCPAGAKTARETIHSVPIAQPSQIPGFRPKWNRAQLLAARSAQRATCSVNRPTRIPSLMSPSGGWASSTLPGATLHRGWSRTRIEKI